MHARLEPEVLDFWQLGYQLEFATGKIWLILLTEKFEVKIL